MVEKIEKCIDHNKHPVCMTCIMGGVMVGFLLGFLCMVIVNLLQ